MLSDGQDPGQRKAALVLAGVGLFLTLTAVWLVINRLPTDNPVIRPASVPPDLTQRAGWYMVLTVSLLTVILFCAVLFFWRWGRKLKEHQLPKSSSSSSSPATAGTSSRRGEPSDHSPGDPT